MLDALDKIREAMERDEAHWQIPFMDFVDEFRREKCVEALRGDLSSGSGRFNALLASTVEYLCDEAGLEVPAWSWEVPGLANPWFVSGLENLKAISIAESPVYFRRRKIFVLKNFLSRA